MRLYFYLDCSFKAMRSDLAIRITYVNRHVYIIGPRWRVLKYTEADSLLAFGSLLEVHTYPGCCGASVGLHCQVKCGFL